MPPQFPELDAILEEAAAEKCKSLRLVTLSCPQCGVFFNPTRKWQRFCSPRCRRISHVEERAEALQRQADEIEALRAENDSLKQSLSSKGM